MARRTDTKNEDDSGPRDFLTLPLHEIVGIRNRRRKGNDALVDGGDDHAAFLLYSVVLTGP